MDTSEHNTVAHPVKFSRRLFFAGAAGAGTLATVGGGALYLLAQQQHQSPADLKATTPPSQQMQIGHLLRRAGFGMHVQDYTTYHSLSYTDAVDKLLDYEQTHDDALEATLKSLNLDLTRPQDQQRWWLTRMVATQRPLLEKMTLFWHGYLTSSYRKVGGNKVYQRMIEQNNFFRAHAFDSFDNLLLGITKDPAMLFYLDLTKSTKKSPNENYARELMELFTLGLGHYSQDDVTAAAMALTGWHVKGRATTAQYSVKDQNKQQLTFLGQKGVFTDKDVIRMLTNHPAAGPFLCRKIFTFFAYEQPSDADIKPLVDAYNGNNHSVKAVLKALFLSPQFQSPKAYRARIKSPIEFVVGSYRALHGTGDAKDLIYQTTTLGQTVFDPPNVGGWPGDKVSAAWLNSGTWLARLNYLNLILSGGKSKTSSYKPFSFDAFVQQQQIASPEQFVDAFANLLLDGNLEPKRKALLVEYFKQPASAPGQQSLKLLDGKSYPVSNVRGTVYLLMASPEFQLN